METVTDIRTIQEGYNVRNAIESRLCRELGAIYSCECYGAYRLFCCNPACKSNGYRGGDNGPAHKLPKELIDGVKAERREKRAKANRTVSAEQVSLWEQASIAVKAYKREHPTRKFVTIETPEVSIGQNAYYIRTEADPFHDWDLPRPKYISWQTVRVNLVDGSWKPSTGEPEITREQIKAVLS